MKTVGMGAGPAQESDLERENRELRERVEVLEKENRELKEAGGKAPAKKKKQPDEESAGDEKEQ